MTGRIASRWERAAISGITPPYSAKMSIWDTTTFERICGEELLDGKSGPRTMAAEVSSQEVSIARMFIFLHYIISWGCCHLESFGILR